MLKVSESLLWSLRMLSLLFILNLIHKDICAGHTALRVASTLRVKPIQIKFHSADFLFICLGFWIKHATVLSLVSSSINEDNAIQFLEWKYDSIKM